ncbi:MAG: hypothetical protein WKF77_20860 [Planctomycetaceae bacterium]
MSILHKRMPGTAHKNALWAVSTVRGQNDEENWGMLQETGSTSCSECILRSTLALPNQRAAGYQLPYAQTVPKYSHCIRIIRVAYKHRLMAKTAEKQRPEQNLTSAPNIPKLVETSALNPYIWPDISAE